MNRGRILLAGWAIILVVLLAAVGGGVARADEGVPTGGSAPSASSVGTWPGAWIDWNGDHFFGPCNGDCGLVVLSGKELETAMNDIPGPKIRPWDWRWGPSMLISGAFSRRLVTFGNMLEIVPEIGIGKRFGADAKAAEVWTALGIYWTAFPWNDYVKTRVGVVTGPNFATQIDHGERRQALPGRTGSDLLFNYSPEVDFSLPQVYPAYEFVVRLHHRSGLLQLINHVAGGMQYFEFGLRAHF